METVIPFLIKLLYAAVFWMVLCLMGHIVKKVLKPPLTYTISFVLLGLAALNPAWFIVAVLVLYFGDVIGEDEGDSQSKNTPAGLNEYIGRTGPEVFMITTGPNWVRMELLPLLGLG